MNPKEEGVRAFKSGKKESECPYTKDDRRSWLIGYYEAELNEIKGEQDRLLSQMTWYDEPYSGLENTVNQLQEAIKKLKSGRKVIII